MDVDLGDLVDLEHQFYEVGYRDGWEHGRLHGLIEGRALGKEKGFEIWEELGFYLGFASTWKMIIASQQNSDESRISIHISHLLELINRFPVHNPTPQLEGKAEDSDLDMSTLLNRIRGKYKALCSSIGIRPRLTPSSTSYNVAEERASDLIEEAMEEPGASTLQSSEGNRLVWSFTATVQKVGPEGMTF